MPILDGFFLKTKGFLPKVYEIFWSEMPLVKITPALFGMMYMVLSDTFRSATTLFLSF